MENLLTSMLCLTVAFAGVREAGSQEPIFQGKPLAEWIRLLKDPDGVTREESVVVLTKLGSAAKPAIADLLPLLKDEQPTVRFQTAVALWKIDRQTKPVVPLMTAALKDRLLRLQDSRVLVEIGQDAKEAAPVFADLLLEPMEGGDDLFVHENGVKALLRFGDSAMPSLIKAMQSKHAVTRSRIAKGLGEMGPRAKNAVQPLAAVLNDADPGVVLYGAIALWKIDGQTEITVPCLIKILNDGTADGHRSPAALTLGEMGVRAKVAVPHLLKARADGPTYLRKPAELALKKIDPDAAAKAGIP